MSRQAAHGSRASAALGAALIGCLVLGFPLVARADELESYRALWGLNPRTVVWFVAELHLMFGAFVLGVPVFGVILEIVGARGSDPRFDRLARECTKLLSAAFATTASLGALLAFVVIGFYPRVMHHFAGALHGSFYIYGLLFFAEAFTLYYYYYTWDRLSDRSPNERVVARWLARWLKIPAALLGAAFVALAFYLFFYNGEASLASLGPTAEQLSQGASPQRSLPGIFTVFAILTPIFLVVFGVQAWGSSRKSLHIFYGILLNIVGLTLMVIANSWTTYMMSPTGFNEAGQFVGDTWGAVSNFLWRPLNLHRLLGNVAFGGFVVGAYAAVRFLTTRDPDQRAYYDWMGYIGNFVGICGLLALPFAGYYLGREIYSFSPVMGNDMMGGFFSWIFVMQAVLIGFLFIGANYYLWSGMERIEGAERYRPWVKFILAALILSFLVWVTPHNLPLRPSEAAQMGGQYHPVLKYLGLMPAKNAAVNFILLSTYWSFMLYRRANKGEVADWNQSGFARFVVVGVAVLTATLVGAWAAVVFRLDLHELSLTEAARPVVQFHAWFLVAHIVAQVVAVGLAFKNHGKLGQGLLLAFTAIVAAGVFGVSGYWVLGAANPFLRHLAVCQVLLVLATMILATAIDVALFRGAREVGRIRWGAIGARPQYTLLLLCVTIVLTMGLMGYLRAGLRQDWHFYGVLKDTSAQAVSPGLAEMGWTVAAITTVFLALVAFLFWLGGLAGRPEPPASLPSPNPRQS